MRVKFVVEESTFGGFLHAIFKPTWCTMSPMQILLVPYIHCVPKNDTVWLVSSIHYKI